MPFTFLKYLQPTNYFTLKRKNKDYVFPVIQALPEHLIAQIEMDSQYDSALAMQYDASWQAIQKGYIGDTKTHNKITALPITDEYRFIKKYFHTYWSWYVLVLRLLSFKNPIHEVSAFLKNRKVSRSTYLQHPLTYTKWKNYASPLLAQQPKVSVIIPTLNRYKYLHNVLRDLEKQDYANFEVIVVDQSQPFQKEFYKQFQLEIQLIYQKEKALWLARNSAIKKANGDFLLLFDDDSRVATNWISNHLKCLDFFQAQISSGVSISTVGAKVPENYTFFKISDQLDTGNVLIKKEVFKQLGLFDRQFEKQRMGDGEFGLRAYLHGFTNISNPYAKRLHLKVGTGGLRQMGSWDGFRPKKWWAPRPIPSVLYFYRSYFGNKNAQLALVKTVPFSVIPYQWKQNKLLMIVGVLVSFIIFPIVILQVRKSWQLATKKIKQGDWIEKY